MSTIIMSACWPLIMSPVQKSVLISLADNANDCGVCWPSIKSISVRCCLSERAVQCAVKWLELNKVLERDLRNQKSTIYTIKPDEFVGETAKTVHYVYRIDHMPSGRFYIGLRTTTMHPSSDPYIGSGSFGAWLEANRAECKKTILGTFSSRQEAAVFETLEISYRIQDPLCLNRKISSPLSDGAAWIEGAGDAPASGAPAGGAPSTPQEVRVPPAGDAPGTVIEPPFKPSPIHGQQERVISHKPKCSAKAIIDLFNEILTELPQVVMINKDRESKIKARWNESEVHQDYDFWRDYFVTVKSSPFLTGKTPGSNGKTFRCSFDWLICPSNFVKVVEGNYNA